MPRDLLCFSYNCAVIKLGKPTVLGQLGKQCLIWKLSKHPGNPGYLQPVKVRGYLKKRTYDPGSESSDGSPPDHIIAVCVLGNMVASTGICSIPWSCFTTVLMKMAFLVFDKSTPY